MKKFIERIKNEIGNEYIVTEVTKTYDNDYIAHGISIKRVNDNFAPVFYYNEHYTFEENVKFTLRAFKIAHPQKKINLEEILDFNKSLPRVYNHTTTSFDVNYVTNKIYKTDLSCIYIIPVDYDEIQGFIKIPKNIPSIPDNIHDIAIRNMEKNVKIESLGKILGFYDLPENIHVVRSLNNNFGFSVVLTDKVKKFIITNYGCLQNVIIIPSSIHEAIIIDKSIVQNIDFIKQMISSVNDTTVEKSEQLSNNAYHYNAKGELEIC